MIAYFDDFWDLMVLDFFSGCCIWLELTFEINFVEEKHFCFVIFNLKR